MSNFNSLLEAELLCHGLVSGVLLLVPQTGPVYSHGILTEDISKEEWQQFSPVFKDSSPAHDAAVSNRGFQLTLASNKQPLGFKIYRKTMCSAYAISDNSREGLVVCKLPHSILVCVFPATHNPAQVIVLVENLADRLRK